MNLLFFVLFFGFGAQADDKNWSQGTAHVLPRGRWEMGLFSPLRVGVKDGLEFEIHPGWTFLAPHFALKKDLFEVSGWNVAFRQSLAYPTFLLRFLARPGTGGVIAPDSKIPHIISSDSRFLFTRNLGPHHNLTLRWRGQLAGGFGESQWVTIDAPLAYTRTSAYHHIFSMNGGIRFDGQIYKALGYQLDMGAWWLPSAEGKWAYEEFCYLTLRPSKRFSMHGGAILVYGSYPYDTNWHLIPAFDMMFSWGG